MNRVAPDLSEPIDLHLQDDGFDKYLSPGCIQVSNDGLQPGIGAFCRTDDDRVRGLIRKDLDGGLEFAQRPERWACTWCRLCNSLRSGDEIGQDGGKVGRIGISQFVDECPSFWRKVPHGHDLMDIPFRDDSETTDFERRHEHAVRLVLRDLGRRIDADFPPSLLDDIV